MIRVLIAEDMHIVRAALVALLDLEPDISVVAAVASGDLILPAALEHLPDVAVIDVALPVQDGLTSAIELHAQVPTCRTLILTSMAQPGVMRRALAAKVCGFIPKDAPPAQLADAIRRVASGLRVIDLALALSVWDTPDNPLTTREMDVVQLAAEGTETAEIARLLSLSQGTVRNYLTQVVTKVNARNRVDALRIIREAGWL
ncbi:MAG TPA: response regulator transcription factor [Dermatophilaceae bacterium]|nr:response regulator transcription factor [Dermatophilaceae bacterium]